MVRSIFTEEENQFIRENYGKLGAKGVAEALGKTPMQIKGRANNMGVTRPRKYSYNKLFFETINTEEKAYWLGFIYADGYVIHNYEQSNFEFAIELHEDDASHLKKFNKAMNSNVKITKRSRSKESLAKYTNDENYAKICHSCQIRYYSKELVESLIQKGVIQNKTYSLEFSKFIKDKQLTKHFIRGFFDGDGCLSVSQKGHSTASFRSWKYEFAKDLSEYFSREAGISYVEPIMDGTSYKVNYGRRAEVEKLAKFLYEDAEIYLDRKYNLYKTIVCA